MLSLLQFQIQTLGKLSRHLKVGYIDLPKPCDLEVTDCDLVLQLNTGCLMLAMERRQTHNQAFSDLFKEQSFMDQG